MGTVRLASFTKKARRSRGGEARATIMLPRKGLNPPLEPLSGCYFTPGDIMAAECPRPWGLA